MATNISKIELPPKLTIATAGENLHGRDFFVGDIHGHYQEFIKGLKKLRFDADCDRVFAVGDLIDRGPDSLKCLRLLNQNWFYSCIGNHEQLFYKKHSSADKSSGSGKNWQYQLTPKEKKECLDLITSMPLAITIESSESRTGVIHSGVPFNKTWPDFIQLLENHDKDAITFALYDRNIVHQKQVIEGVDYIFVGYQGLEKVASFGNQICIDTAVFIDPLPNENYGLSFAWVEDKKPQFLLVNR